MEGHLLTLGQVAERLHVSRATARRLINRGSVPIVVLSGGSRRRLVRIREDALERALLRLERAHSERKERVEKR
jgi:excisionase family DNA binding protein